MYELKTNTAVRIPVGPLVDPGDGKTAEVALTVTDLSVQIYQIKTDGTAVVRTQFAPTASGGNNDMVHVTDDTAGVYDLELTASQLNWLGNGRITFYDVDGFLVHWIDILVVSAAYFDWKYGTTKPEMNLADDAITAAKYDESTAFPLKSADTGSTAVARTGADADTLETLSDQMDASYARLGAPAGASVSADIAAVKSETAAEVADAVWDEVLDTAHEVAGSASVLLQASGAAGDPMSVSVPGSYAEGTAGYVIGHLESSGSGSVYWPYTVTDSATGNPIEGVTVSVSTDLAGSVVIASGTTNASGVVNFNLDPGTYYLWLSKTGYTFSNPDQEEVV